MRVFVIASALLALAVATPVYRVIVKEDGLGAYKLEYEGEDVYRKEMRSANGDTAGTFRYKSPEGQTYAIDFVSGANQGFVATGTHLPTPVVNPEVLSATNEHLKVWEETARVNGIFNDGHPRR